MSLLDAVVGPVTRDEFEAAVRDLTAMHLTTLKILLDADVCVADEYQRAHAAALRTVDETETAARRDAVRSFREHAKHDPELCVLFVPDDEDLE